jgi:N-acetylneuraminate synthase
MTAAAESEPVQGLAPRAPGQAFVVAEVAQAHEGSLGLAHSFIDAAAVAGADAIKFQTHLAAAESTRDETFRIAMSGQDETRMDYWRRMEFTAEQWSALSRHAREKGLVFLCSAFSLEAVDLLDRLQIPAWKVASGETENIPLLEAMCRTGKPILLSSGMSDWQSLDRSVAFVREHGNEFAVFQCTSMYPTPLEKVGVNVITELRDRYDCPVGLSDHSGSVYPALYALAMGVELLEFHLTFDRLMYGPDAVASLTVDELTQVCEANRSFAALRRHPVSKDGMATDLSGLRELFTRSLALKDDGAKGDMLDDDMIVEKKPGTGIAPSERHLVVGKRLSRDVRADRLLLWEDLA